MNVFLLSPLIPAKAGIQMNKYVCAKGALSIRWIPGQAGYERI